MNWESLKFGSPGAKVDRENNVIRGYVIAQLGWFKSEGRGQFDAESLRLIHSLAMASGPVGLKSRFTHPDMSNDGLGSFLGRARNPKLESDRVRADLHLDPTSFKTPRGDIGGYVMDLAESDPDAFSSSLVLRAERVDVLDERGNPKVDDNGNEIPPIWRPTKLHASDVVDTGDAVDGFLSAGIDPDNLPLGVLWKADEMLGKVFANMGRVEVEQRLGAYLGRYLDRRFGPEAKSQTAKESDVLATKIKLARLTAAHTPS